MLTIVSNLTILACWLILFAYWIAKGRGVKPVVEQQSRAATRTYRIPLLLGGILLWAHLRYSPVTQLWRAFGAAACAAGLLVAVWARRTLAGNWSRSVTFKQGHELVQAGPYRFARHPIYTGMLLMCSGSAIAGGRLHCWLGFLIICAGFWIKLRQEESLMLRHFPDEYPAYRTRVKALVPFLL